MILIYRPEDGDEQHWDLADVKVTFAEAKAAEQASGVQWSQLEQELVNGNVSALQAALWVMRKRGEPTLTFADLEDIPLGAVATEYGPQEKAFMRTYITADASLTPEQREAALAVIGDDASEAEETPAPKGKKAA